MAHIFQINTSPGGLPKLPQTEALISELFVGEDRHNYKGHGGLDAAVCLYSLEVITALQEEGHPVFPGALGENLTITGINWYKIKMGTKFKIGDEVLLEVTSFAAPCSKLEPYLNDILRVSHARFPGWGRPYCRVLQTGTVQIGDTVKIIA